MIMIAETRNGVNHDGLGGRTLLSKNGNNHAAAPGAPPSPNGDNDPATVDAPPSMNGDNGAVPRSEQPGHRRAGRLCVRARKCHAPGAERHRPGTDQTGVEPGDSETKAAAAPRRAPRTCRLAGIVGERRGVSPPWYGKPR